MSIVKITSIENTSERKESTSGQMQEAWKLASKLEIISITILLLKCFKQLQPQEQAISSSLDEISSHASILSASESQCFLGPPYLIVRREMIYCTYSPKLYFSHSVVKGRKFYLKTPHRSQSPERHLQLSISIKTSISKMKE